MYIKLILLMLLSITSQDLFALRITGNIHDAEYIRPENNRGRAGYVKFRRLSIDTPSMGISLSNGRVFDSSIRLNRRYISFSGANHSFGFSFSDEKTLEFADYFNVLGTTFDIKERSLDISSDLVKYGKNNITASFYNFTANCKAYPRKYFSDTENIYYGCVNELSITGKADETARIEASSVLDFIGQMDIETELTDATINQDSINANLNDSKLYINGIKIAELPTGLQLRCDKDQNVINSDYNKIINDCIDSTSVQIPSAQLSGIITKHDEPLFTANGSINNIILSTKDQLSLDIERSNVEINGINTSSDAISLKCNRALVDHLPATEINLNGTFNAMIDDCTNSGTLSINNLRTRVNIGEEQKELRTYFIKGDMDLNEGKINFRSDDISLNYNDTVARLTHIDLSCDKSDEFKLNLTSFDKSCSNKLIITPKDNRAFSYLTATIPNDEGAYEIKAQVRNSSIQNNKINGELTRTKITIAPDKDIYLDKILIECLNHKESLVDNYQVVIDRCLTDFKMDRTQLIYKNEVDNYRYYTDVRDFKLQGDRLTANIYGVQLKGKSAKDTSITIKGLDVSCFRLPTQNPLSYQEQIDYCLENAQLNIDRIILPNKRNDPRNLYEYYNTMISSNMEGINPIDLVNRVEPKVKNIVVRATDLNLSLSLKAKVAGVWINVRIGGRVINHDKENKKITLRRTSSNIAPFILKTGIKMAVPESLVKVDGDNFIIKYY